MFFFGWMNNWPFTRFLQPILALLLLIGFLLGCVFWVYIMFRVWPWLGIFFLVCVVAGVVIGLGEMILGRHRVEDTDLNG